MLGCGGLGGELFRGGAGVGEGLGFGDEAVEEGAAGGADVVTALGVPLDSEEELGVGGGMFHVEHLVVGVLFHGLDDTIVWAASDDAEAFPRGGDGLVVAGVDGKAEEAVGFGGLVGGEEGGEKAVGSDEGRVGDGDFAAGFMVDGQGGEILDEGAAAPDVERLDAEADAEYGLGEFVGMVEEEVVDGFAGGVGGSGGGIAVGTVKGWVYVGGAAGEEKAVATGGEDVDLRGREGEVDGYGLAAGVRDRGGVVRPGALVVGKIPGGGERNGDAWLHIRALNRSGVLIEGYRRMVVKRGGELRGAEVLTS